jgi:ATP-dependent helicase/nuclease subunit A
MICILDADTAQRRALAPGASVWVAASAGTGKTKVLTDRLLSLMLDGTDPAHILCLTFTRAAAAEMANRVNERLAAWTTLPPGRLAQELQQLTGRMPDEYDIARARQLFARVLDTPGGAKIATIHAFCQSLLRRFPLEAGVPPEFVLIEERSATDALREAAEHVIATARGGAAPELAEALAIVARYAAEERFAELIEALAQDRAKLRQAMADGANALRARIGGALAVPPDATTDNLVAAFCAPGGGDELGLRAASEALANGSKKDKERGAIISRWCENPGGRADLVDEYIGALLTQEGTILEILITKAAAAKANCDASRILYTEAERIIRFVAARAATALRDASCALARLGDALLAEYERRKRLHGQLDYDDLVTRALELLHRPGIAPWVLFKLDGGLDHILIDEAQDTNPEQWAIVAALAEEFFAGEGAAEGFGERNRTVFAVGDAKQSIYSFQRADPRAFVEMRAHFQARVTAARKEWRVVPLEISFRATEPLLRAVDAIFAGDAADGVALDGSVIRHIASRAGNAGIVELWPPVPAAAEEPPDPLAEIDTQTVEPRFRLARAIAAQIRQWLDAGERLEARDQPIRPGDIMVLVRRRNEFVGDLVRALKQRSVPVAGADRLLLTEQLAVQDLVALGQFLLLPEDNLNLATVLKGPLFDISEEDLFRLAYNRGERSLWTRLHRLSREHANLRAALDRLSGLLARADFVPPFELYAEILGAGGGRRAILERLGPDAADPIDEFLALALAYEREHVPSLQGFLHWLMAGEVEIKRDFGARAEDEVRIMTVHGAKGLEAPVVILPDTTQLPDRRIGLLWSEEDGLPLWCPRRDLRTAQYIDERDRLRGRQMQEYRRLLYVALTRAQDRLYLCGWDTRNGGRDAPSWHALCRAGLGGIAESFEFDASGLIGERDGWHGEGLRLTAPQTVTPKSDQPLLAQRGAAPVPDWASQPAPAEPDPPKPLLPSRPNGAEPGTLSPLAVSGRDRFKRGLLVHRLLQSLPELPAGERAAAARRFLALPLHELTPDEQDEIGRETLAVIEHPDFAELWGPQAQAEVPVVGLIGAQALSGQIDRLVVTDERVLIVDYKTLRPPPQTEADVPLVYLRQLATYRSALARIYRDRAVECALLWTEGPRLMLISSARLAGLAVGDPS